MPFDRSTDLCKRNRMTMFFTVEIACGIGDVFQSAKYMAARGVPLEVARRVLLTPNRRRGCK